MSVQEELTAYQRRLEEVETEVRDFYDEISGDGEIDGMEREFYSLWRNREAALTAFWNGIDRTYQPAPHIRTKNLNDDNVPDTSTQILGKCLRPLKEMGFLEARKNYEDENKATVWSFSQYSGEGYLQTGLETVLALHNALEGIEDYEPFKENCPDLE